MSPPIITDNFAQLQYKIECPSKICVKCAHMHIIPMTLLQYFKIRKASIECRAGWKNYTSVKHCFFAVGMYVNFILSVHSFTHEPTLPNPCNCLHSCTCGCGSPRNPTSLQFLWPLHRYQCTHEHWTKLERNCLAGRLVLSNPGPVYFLCWIPPCYTE